MSQISHKHLLLVYGISVHKSKSKCFMLVKALLTNTLLSNSEHKRANPKKAIKSLCHDLSSLNLRGSRVLLVTLVACQSACEYSHVSKVCPPLTPQTSWCRSL